eukprot:SAG11_NODE_1431_length_4937_cov_1.954940_5_plen_135_part_00
MNKVAPILTTPDCQVPRLADGSLDKTTIPSLLAKPQCSDKAHAEREAIALYGEDGAAMAGVHSWLDTLAAVQKRATLTSSNGEQEIGKIFESEGGLMVAQVRLAAICCSVSVPPTQYCFGLSRAAHASHHAGAS